MIRTILSDEQWERIAPELPGKVGDPGATARDNRLFLEAVLWIARTGAPLARSTAAIRQLVHRLHPVLAVGTKGYLGANFQAFVG